MRKRFLSALLVLCFVVAGLVAVPPSPASATPPTEWTTTYSTGYATLSTYENGKGMQLSSCNNSSVDTKPNGGYVDANGVTRSTLLASGARCINGSGHGAEDGTLYSTRLKSSGGWSELVARKNDRDLWTTELSLSEGCRNTYSMTEPSFIPTSISEGNDGNVYMILISYYGPCQDYLVGINPTTGLILMSEPIGNGPATGSGLGWAPQSAWTYDDIIIVVDRSGVVREFEYDGTEDTLAAYQLPMPYGHYIDRLVSNNDGTVFAMTRPTWSFSVLSTMLYHKRNGDHGSIADTYMSSLGSSAYQLQPTADGSVVALGGGVARIDHFDLSTDTVSASYPSPATTGYATNSLDGYFEDESGNKILMWSHASNSWTDTAISVDVFDASSTTTGTAFLAEMKQSDPTNYPVFNDFSGGRIRDAIGGGNLFLAACQMDGANCSSTEGVLIYKIDVGNFGEPIGKVFKRNDYESQKLEYVAMGDSFSSGEGNPDFNPWTDRGGMNECHRSKEKAYPTLLAEDQELNLDFVACSGATTNDVLGIAEGDDPDGKGDEPAQIDALSETTDIVTVTIGGNDVGFVDYAFACFVTLCSWGTPAYTDITTSITAPSFEADLSAVYLTILNEAENAEVYVLNYPYIITDEEDDGCLIIDDTTLGTSDQAVEEVVTMLNTAIMSAYLDIKQDEGLEDVSDRLHFVETSSWFEGLDRCAGSESGFNGYDLGNVSYSLHPNEVGHQAYFEAMKSQLD